MGERWPPVYDAAELQGVIRDLGTRAGLAKQMYALETELPLLDEQGQPAADQRGVSHWLVLGNSCDLARSQTEAPYTQLLPIYEIVAGITQERVATLTGYRVSRQFHLPDWAAGNRVLYADFLKPVTIDRRGLLAKGQLTARMTRIGWMLLHACTVRFLCRDDGRFD